MRLLQIKAVDAAANATTTFGKIDSGYLYAASFIASFSDAAAAGTVKIQASNAPTAFGNLADDFTPPATSWVDVPSASTVVAAGATVYVPMPLNFSFRWIRIVWTRTAGAGTLTVDLCAQG